MSSTSTPETASIPSVRSPRAGAIVTAQFLALGLIWGSSFLFMKVALGGVSFGQVAWARLVLGALTLGVIAIVMRVQLPRSPRVYGHLTVIAIFYAVIPHQLFAWAEQYVSSSLASIYNAVTPLMTALFAALLFRVEKFDTGRVAGVVLGFVGVIVIVAPWQVGALTGDVRGQLACLGAVACYGFTFGYMRRFLSPYALQPITAAFLYISIAAVIMVLLTPIVAWSPVQLDVWVVLSLLALGVLGTGVAYLWNMNVFDAWGPTPASSVTYITPVVGVILGIVLLGEHVAWNQPVGGAIIFVGILLAQQRIRLPHRRLPAA
ncbi:EamA domain-containing membrane protein RarD [Labedella gwakjiensis]|uniref:DMT family transporter n=1 Tax=Labedella gwakjiensis TaxID=390269 RepID=A0A2P8GX40_9MICO|nr:DMT family transporter [Labedella gwakjiensis]PSL38536.1 EamA domain-containing membrane protein RarD [Labedella gwakjiensis]RUQ86953.1 DMT family transporter [Labedella gwakjiensis]